MTFWAMASPDHFCVLRSIVAVGALELEDPMSFLPVTVEFPQSRMAVVTRLTVVGL